MKISNQDAIEINALSSISQINTSLCQTVVNVLQNEGISYICLYVYVCVSIYVYLSIIDVFISVFYINILFINTYFQSSGRVARKSTPDTIGCLFRSLFDDTGLAMKIISVSSGTRQAKSSAKTGQPFVGIQVVISDVLFLMTNVWHKLCQNSNIAEIFTVVQ